MRTAKSAAAGSRCFCTQRRITRFVTSGCPEAGSSAFASNPAASAAYSAGFEANSSEDPSNSATYESNMAELHLTPSQSSILNSAGFGVNTAASDSDSTRVATDRPKVTSPGTRPR
jgi:hypothetical protein